MSEKTVVHAQAMHIMGGQRHIISSQLGALLDAVNYYACAPSFGERAREALRACGFEPCRQCETVLVQADANGARRCRGCGYKNDERLQEQDRHER